MMSTSRVLTVCILLALVAVTSGIRCWKCGQYSDGVGSITPCNNRSAAQLEDCPNNAKYCIKYVSELTIVRDCVPTCSEKEWWGARTFCCDTDECNAGYTLYPATGLLALTLAALFAR
ncbi:neurotoxin BM10-1-like [Galleria mellonella]|uniref:Neurotoxin BM10-1-like n=1 Tax=Galleria mellonella TaxID=7137 RepID=A0ABM3MND6_GALME|nr:neurotoxin BM10-1-like [Galleria mellonella]XP_052752868.1 neurotoxin BM10-1-like [Galleria mellonella]